MGDSQELILNPHKQLLFAVSNTHHLLGSLSEEVETLDALVNDFGERMSPDIRERWKSKLAQTLQSCEVNSLDLTDETQGLCLATLRAIEGKFYEVVDKNYQDAGSCYERAANVLASMPKPQLEKLMTNIAKGSLANLNEDSTSNKKKVEFEEGLGVVLAFSYRIPEVELWNYAGDTYCRAGTPESGRRCYDIGLQTSSEQLAGEVVESWATALRQINCRLSLSIAVAILIPSDELERCEALYRQAADNMFFNIDKRDNIVYQDICGILVYGSGITPYGFVEPDWFPRVPVSIEAQKNERLLRLKAELGKRALDTLRADFEKSEEGFPVPETYFLVMMLSDIYRRLQEYEKCINLLTSGSHDFDDAFYEWTYDELTGAHDWAFCFIEHTENVSFVKGLLQRPDYKEFVERMKKAEESHQRLEWRQIRFERVLEKVGDRAGLEKVHNQLTTSNPWLNDAANPGSVLNAELIYQQLKKTNWGEVVMGYCNALEEELKGFVYNEYLAFVAGQSDKNYGHESQRQNKQGSVLYFIASTVTNRLGNQIWNNFVKARMPEDKDFLSNQLPNSLAVLIEMRNPSAHGKMSDRAKAEKAREIVLGKQQPGLLAKLVEIRKSKKGTL
jgi:hypothetical protein